MLFIWFEYSRPFFSKRILPIRLKNYCSLFYEELVSQGNLFTQQKPDEDQQRSQVYKDEVVGGENLLSPQTSSEDGQVNKRVTI